LDDVGSATVEDGMIGLKAAGQLGLTARSRPNLLERLRRIVQVRSITHDARLTHRAVAHQP
jgi:hypothetical protein